MHAADAVIVAQDVRKRYDAAERDAVAGVSLQVRRGEVFGLLGPNGAGKTTLVEMLTGFRSATSGTLRVLGLDPSRRSERQQLRSRAAVVLQESGFPRYLTAREILVMIGATHRDPMPPDEVIELVGLAGSGDKLVRELSGGQQRRLDVGAALMGRPEVIFLDEPTTGFDPAARRAAWALLGRLREFGTSILLTTHYMDEAQALADRVGVMTGGTLVGVGTTAELASSVQLDSVVRFSLPAGVRVDQLPARAREGALAPDGTYELRCADATRVLAELCGWAVDAGVELIDLEVVRPRLEDTYLALTGAAE